MPIQKFLGGLLLAGGIACFAVGMTSGPDVFVMIGAILGGIGALFIVINMAISPLMRSSREIAEASGMEVSKITGAPKLGSSLEMARDRMASAQESFSALSGNAAMRAGGTSGTAVVTSAQETGEVSNLNPVYQVGLTVTPDGGTPYDVTVDSEVNTLGVAKAVPGTRVPVTIDGSDPNNVLVDWISTI